MKKFKFIKDEEFENNNDAVLARKYQISEGSVFLERRKRGLLEEKSVDRNTKTN